MMRLCGIALALVAFCGAVTASAHEIGTTRVSVVFDTERQYRIEIATDAQSLTEKLELSAGRQAAPTDGRDLETRLRSLEDEFRRRVVFAFDASAAQPAFEVSVSRPRDAMTGAVATIRLRGAVPEDAQQFTWKYGWTFASYALTIHPGPDAAGITEWLEGGETSAPFALARLAVAPMRSQIAWRYVRLGFGHIIPRGLDHILFVLGLFLLSHRRRAVLTQVSAFTVAHSITLGLSLYGVISLPASLVEPLIALSIAYVAIENLFTSTLKAWRVALVFGFGLLHGMGFAGALREVGLPRSEFLTALLTFNVGVELGQLTVIGAAIALVGWHCDRRAWYRRLVVVPASALIASVALYWTVARIVS